MCCPERRMCCRRGVCAADEANIYNMMRNAGKWNRFIPRYDDRINEIFENSFNKQKQRVAETPFRRRSMQLISR